MEVLRESVERFLNLNDNTGELELRLGHVDGSGKFIAGVSKCVFDQLEQDMKESPSLKADEKWTEIIDYHFTTPDKQPIRTRVMFHAGDMSMHKTHITKKTLQNVMVKRLEDENGERCRIALCRETPVDFSSLPGTCIPTFVRVKQRKCFRDVRNDKVVWSYELAKCWSASNRSSVEHMQHLSEPVYEVECELIDEAKGYSAEHSIDRIVESLMVKSHLLLGEDQRQKVEVVASDTLQEKKKRKRVVRQN